MVIFNEKNKKYFTDECEVEPADKISFEVNLCMESLLCIKTLSH